MAASDGCICLSQYRSEFVCTLQPLVRARYETKVLLCCGVDPYCLRKDDFSTNFEYLPKLQFPDISNYFVLQVQTSFYTKNEMKAFKSMDAYIFFVWFFFSFVAGFTIFGGNKYKTTLIIYLRGWVWIWFLKSCHWSYGCTNYNKTERDLNWRKCCTRLSYHYNAISKNILVSID